MHTQLKTRRHLCVSLSLLLNSRVVAYFVSISFGFVQFSCNFPCTCIFCLQILFKGRDRILRSHLLQINFFSCCRKSMIMREKGTVLFTKGVLFLHLFINALFWYCKFGHNFLVYYYWHFFLLSFLPTSLLSLVPFFLSPPESVWCRCTGPRPYKTTSMFLSRP